MAATLFGLTVDEAIAGVTREAARALGRLGEIGTLEPGKWCDLAIWNIERPAELVYRIGFNPLACAGLERHVTAAITLTPGRATLADWRAIVGWCRRPARSRRNAGGRGGRAGGRRHHRQR